MSSLKRESTLPLLSCPVPWLMAFINGMLSGFCSTRYWNQETREHDLVSLLSSSCCLSLLFGLE